MEAHKKTVAIGIFAHNEMDNIVTTLESLAQQDVFSLGIFPDYHTTVSVLANGCTDETANIAEAYLSQVPALNGNIVVIDKPGKSNAWNEFIHSSESEFVDYFVCMDSDITFGSGNVISRLIDRLSASEEAYLAVDIAEKDTLLKSSKTISEKISLIFSRMMKQGSTAVAGSLYCAKGERLRKIYMPEGLPVEDGFLRAMIVTDLFTKKDNNKRILVVDDACHYFTPDASIRSLLKHEERLLIGTFINSVIYGYLWETVAHTQIDAGSLVARNNNERPNWVEELIVNYREKHDPLIPKHFYYKYWSRWKTFGPSKKILSFTLVSIASIVKFCLIKKIEKRLSRESGLGFW